jgi:MFS family permease
MTVVSISRTAQRTAVGSLFFLHGLCFSSWASRIPAIQNKLSLTESELGMVLLAIPIGLLLSMPFSGWLTSNIGSRKTVIVGIILYGIALSCIPFAGNIPQLMIALFFYGTTGNLVNISVNTQAVGVESLYQRSIMASFHGLWSLAGFIGAALGSLMISRDVPPGSHFLLVSILVVSTVLYSGRFLYEENGSKERGSFFVIPDKSLLILGLIAFACMMCEGAMFDWSGVYFQNVVLAEKNLVGIGYATFMGTMALGRFFADKFTTRFGFKTTLHVSGVLMASGLFLSVLLPYFYTATFGFLLVGFGVSSVVPLVFGAAGKSTTMAPGLAISAVSTIGFIGFLIGPPLIGFIAGASSLKFSFGLIGIIGSLVALLAFVMKK